MNSAFAELLRRHGWQSFDSIWARSADAAIAKNLRTDRVTLRFTLDDCGTERSFYIKRHVRSSWKEYVKPLLRLTWPILGARNEWNAILDFHSVGLPTMTPVAFGKAGTDSFLITEGLEDCTKVSELITNEEAALDMPEAVRSRLIDQIASLARTMHGAGLHHQDFYLGHLLLSNSDDTRLYIIDLGRVQKHRQLSRRWIIKDLAQLNFSATTLLPAERLRFLRHYLGRSLQSSDRTLIDRIKSKTASIGRHSRKNRL